jgi:endonuclease/exonuclease/phosphatase (EEP) superfamily protein YafD
MDTGADRPQADRKARQMTRLITLNIWEGRLPVPLADLLSREQPDIACLQEVVRFADPGYDWIRPGPGELAAWAGLPHTAMAPAYGQVYMHTRLELGNATLSRSPIPSQATIWTDGRYLADFDMTEHEFPRNFQHTMTGGVHIINHHGRRERDAPKNGSGKDTATMEFIAGYASKLDGKVIVAGDFNLWPSSPSLDPLRACMRDLGDEAGIKNTRTWLKGRDEVSDYVFVSDTVGVSDFYASDIVASDHAALVLDFE